MIKDRPKIQYEPDSDVLSWEVSNKPIDFAEEIGNVVVHFSKDNIPVLFEILDASKFITKAENLIRDELKISTKRILVPASR